MAKIIFRVTEYPDKRVTISVFAPEFKYSNYQGTIQLSVVEWEQLQSCIQVGYEENPVGLVLEYYHGTPDKRAPDPAAG